MKTIHVVAIALGFIIICGIGLAGCPVYNVWQQGLAGKAALERAQQERQILVEQAKAELESAEIRSKAISVVGKAAQQYPEYRLQEFLGAFAETLQKGDIDQIIYIPTEANIPLMEATRFVKSKE